MENFLPTPMPAGYILCSSLKSKMKKSMTVKNSTPIFHQKWRFVSKFNVILLISRILWESSCFVLSWWQSVGWPLTGNSVHNLGKTIKIAGRIASFFGSGNLSLSCDSHMISFSVKCSNFFTYFIFYNSSQNYNLNIYRFKLLLSCEVLAGPV